MKFSIVDAFTGELFGGNPAGVVILPDGQDFPAADVMRKTAAELRYSETAFIKRLDNGEFNVRYFTPADEVELCGHATIGAFYALMDEGYISAGNTYINNTLAGRLEIVVNEDSILMDMGDPQDFGLVTGSDKNELYAIMGISSEGQGKVQDSDTYLETRKISTGLTDIMMPVADEKELEKINPDYEALSELSKRHGVVGVHAFTVNAEDGKLHARNFAPLYDIDEEAATGTSNGALTYYLYDYGIVKAGAINRVIQGENMGRPSEISTQILSGDGGPKIKVGGMAVTLASGEINL